MTRELREIALDRGDRRSSMWVYKTVRALLRVLVNPWVRTRSVNAEVIDQPGPLILAPVHRSHLDSALIATQTERRIRALGKESLFTTPGVSYLCAALGAIPVRRGAADRDALSAAKALLERGEAMIVFPEGTRRTGNDVVDLYDGAAWLAARTGAPVVPIGVAGTERALPPGAKRIYRSYVAIACGEPLPAPVASNGKKVNRADMASFTQELQARLQDAQNEAVALAAR